MDPLEEPVVDVSVGGYELPYQVEGFLAIWVVTINGRVCCIPDKIKEYLICAQTLLQEIFRAVRNSSLLGG